MNPRRRRPEVLLLLLLLPLLPGCLAATGGAVAALLGSGDGGSGGSPPPPPPQIQAPLLDAPVIPLAGTPAAVVIGDFFPDGGAEVNDVAVVAGDRTILSLLEGDGQGGFRRRVDLELGQDASLPRDLAKVVRPGGRLDSLLVATSQSLIVVAWSEPEGKFVSRTLPLSFDQGQRQVAVGDFDGNGIPDAAVSGQQSNSIAIFRGEESTDGSYQPVPLVGNDLVADSPRALAAADFDVDGKSDLVVLDIPNFMPTLRLLLSDGTWGFTEQSRHEEPDLTIDSGATIDVRDGATFRDTRTSENRRTADDDPFPDFIVCRLRNILRVLVRQDSGGKPILETHPRPTGPPTQAPGGAVLVQLPREPEGSRDTWDIVAVDTKSDLLSLQYGGADNLGGNSTSSRWPLPGEALALAAGDLDGDLLEDLVAVTVGPSLPDGVAPSGLTALLANREMPGVEDAPFRYRQAAVAGENLPSRANIETLASGVARMPDGRQLRFVATERLGFEVAIIFLDGSTGEPVGPPESHFLRDEKGNLIDFHSVRISDLDLDGDDDIVVVCADVTLRLLDNEPEGDQAFRWAPGPAGSGVLVDFSSGQLPEGLDADTLNFRRPTLARIDDDDLPDIVVPLSAGLEKDWFAVILDPGNRAPEVRLLQTLRGPRHAAVTEINGDGAPDIVVANEDSHAIHVLLGDPLSPGDFWSGPEVQLEGLDGEVEFIVTDLPDPGFSSGPRDPARAILFSTGTLVGLLLNRTVPLGPVELHLLPDQNENPIYRGFDAEFMIYEDILLDPDEPGRRDLIIGDEDKGDVLVFACLGDPVQEGLGSFSLVQKLLYQGRPDELALFRLYSGTLALVCSSKGTNLQIYLQSCLEDCRFVRRDIIDLSEANQTGTPAGLAGARAEDGRLFLASLAEDGQHITGDGAVDVIPLSPGLDPLGVRDIGEMPAERLLFEPVGATVTPDGVLVGRFAGDDGFPDLLVHDAGIGEFTLLAGTGSTPAFGEPSSSWSIDGPIRALSCVPLTESRDRAFVATDTSVMLIDPDPANGGTEPQSLATVPLGDLLAAAPGRLGTGETFAALLCGNKLHVAAAGQELRAIVEAPESGLIGCADLDGDGRDDIVLVTREDAVTFRGMGGLSFSSRSTASLPRVHAPQCLAFLDANADGRTDLAIGTGEGTVIVLPGDGLGGFPPDAMREVFVWRDIEAILGAPIDTVPGDEILVSGGAPGLFVVRTGVVGP